MKKTLLMTAAIAVSALPMTAQRLAEGYISMPESSLLNTYVSQWNGGKGTIMVNGSAWEDEEFYTSRVKPRTRFYDQSTQVYPALRQHTGTTASEMTGTDKRYLNWVPIGDQAVNALPNARFDSEAFSVWSYVDHWGNWSSPFGWVPGAFADAAHKNGVAVSGVAGMPNATLPSGWATCLEGLVSQGSDAVGKFLYYHGVDGLGYNSEWSSWSPKSKGLTTLHTGLYSYMSTRNPLFENIWYNGTTQNGTCSFDHQINASNSSDLIKGTSMFLNYNWSTRGYAQSDVDYVKGLGLDPMVKLYAGMNQQGSSSDNGGKFSTLRNYQMSIGIWGEHSSNMFWKNHGQGGSTGQAVQRFYLDQTEKWYTGISHNPAIKMTVKDYGIPTVYDDWAGVSALVSARSVLNFDLTKEPFYTFFNIGNGTFFNWKGQRLNDIEWYNLGIQDYLPTWRWWFAPTLLGGQSASLSVSDVKMHAEMTWEDAYVGGSCMKVTGTTTKEYLHLFKSDFNIGNGDRIVLKYKLLGGKGNVSLIGYGLASATATKMTERTNPVFTVDNSEAIEDASYAPNDEGGWQTCEWNIKSAQRLNNWKVTALKFENTESLEMLIGGLWIEKSGVTYATPAAPQINSVKVLANTYTGVDAKLIWTMDNNVGKNAGTPVYNSDVKTSMFKVYSQEEGGEEHFICATTSWAAIAFQCPNTDNGKKIRFGVRAVSMDTKEESAITWTDYQTKPSYTASEDVLVDKAIIKPGESFTCHYADDKHESSTWTIIDASGVVVATATGTSITVADGLENGIYDVVIDKGLATERTLPSFVTITGEGVGALPQIYTLSHNDSEVSSDAPAVEIALTDTPTLAYTGRKADGSASRALALNGHWIGAKLGDMGLQNRQTVSFGGWFKFDAIPDGLWNFLYINNYNDSWPRNEWGWSWFKGDKDGNIWLTFRGNNDDTAPGQLCYRYPNTKIQAGMWMHLMLVCEYDANGRFRTLLYINGVLQESTWFQYTKGGKGNPMLYENKTTLEWCPSINYTRSTESYLLFGGIPAADADLNGNVVSGISIDGIVDDFQVWSTALSESQVKEAMKGYTKDNAPSGLLCYWNFEDDAASDHTFASFGSKSGVKISTHDWVNSEGTAGGEGSKTIKIYEPAYVSGCPLLEGTAFPVVTEAVWSDTDRKTRFEPIASRAAKTAGEEGAATVSFSSLGDHTVTLTLRNSYGEDSKDFPVFAVKEDTQGIDDIVTDGGDMNAYTVDNVLFLEFAQDGAYDIEVYNAAGMLVGSKKLDAVAGQNARITLGAAGVYMVKASVNGRVLRTVKVLGK